jgi:hypothetical protein
MLSVIIISLLISAIIGLILRFIFKLKGKWLWWAILGFLPPIFIAPLSIYYSLIEVGRAAQIDLEKSGSVSIFLNTFDSGLWVAEIWFCVAILAMIAMIWLPKRK